MKSSNPGRRRLPIRCLCALLLVLFSARAASAVDIEVDLEGIDGDLRRNVRALLSIADADADDPTVERLRQLHRRAPAEIRRALEPFGYYQVVIEASLEERSEGNWRAVYTIAPGPPVRLASVDVGLRGEGAEDSGFQSLTLSFPLDVGDVLDHPVYEAGKDSLVEYATSQGYLDATFATAAIRVDLEKYQADLDLTFATGPQYRLGPVTFHQDFLNDNLVRGYVRFEPGEVFDYNELLRLQNSLGDSPYFARVEVEPRREPEPTDRIVPIDVFLTPSKPQKWDVGVGYGTDTGPRFTAGLELRRINRRGHRGDIDFKISQIERTFESRYTIPGAYPRTDNLSFFTGYALKEPDQTSSESYLAGSSYARSRGLWRESYGLVYERTNFTVGPDSGTADLFIPEVATKRIKADDRLFPRKGSLLELRLRGAESELASDVTFGQVVARGKLVRSVSKDIRLLGRLDLGRTFTNRLRELPPSARFFAGGDRSVRGYGYQDLAPADAQCIAAAVAAGLEPNNRDCLIGGKALITGSVEMDWLFYDRWGRWGVAAFYDFGNALDRFDLDLEHGVGAGIRWLSPVGLVRVDVASAVSEPGAPIRLHLSIGPDL